MSVHISSAVWKSNLPNSGQKIVLLALADVANHEGGCWPSVGTIGRMTSLSDSAVRVHLKALQDAKIVTVTRREAEGGRQTSNFFQIHPEALPPESGGGGSRIRRGEAPESGAPSLQNQEPLNRTEEPLQGTTKEEEGDPASPHPVLGSPSAPELFDLPTPKPKLEAPDKLPDFPAASMVAIWNEAVPGAKITALAGQRKNLARARWKELGSKKPAWEAFCRRVGASPFLTGKEASRSKRTFTASFDWAILPGNFIKIQEGKYDPKPNSKSNSDKHEW